MLQLHPALNLLHHRPVRQGLQVPKRRPTVHWVLLLGEVYEPRAAYAVPHYGKGTIRSLPTWRGPVRSRPACLTPDRPIANIFVLTGDIGGQSRGRRREGRRRRMQEPVRQ